MKKISQIFIFVCLFIQGIAFNATPASVIPQRSEPVGLINTDGRCVLNALAQVAHPLIATLAQQDSRDAATQQLMLVTPQKHTSTEFARIMARAAQGYGLYDAQLGTCALFELYTWVQNHYFLVGDKIGPFLMHNLVKGLQTLYGPEKLCFLELPLVTTETTDLTTAIQTGFTESLCTSKQFPEFVVVHTEGLHTYQQQTTYPWGNPYTQQRVSIPALVTVATPEQQQYHVVSMINYELNGMVPQSQLARWAWVVLDKITHATSTLNHATACFRYQDKWFVADDETIWKTGATTPVTADQLGQLLLNQLPGQPMIVIYQRCHDKVPVEITIPTDTGVQLSKLTHPPILPLTTVLWYVYLIVGFILGACGLCILIKPYLFQTMVTMTDRLRNTGVTFVLIGCIFCIAFSVRTTAWLIYLYRYHAATERQYVPGKHHPSIRC